MEIRRHRTCRINSGSRLRTQRCAGLAPQPASPEPRHDEGAQKPADRRRRRGARRQSNSVAQISGSAKSCHRPIWNPKRAPTTPAAPHGNTRFATGSAAVSPAHAAVSIRSPASWTRKPPCFVAKPARHLSWSDIGRPKSSSHTWRNSVPYSRAVSIVGGPNRNGYLLAGRPRISPQQAAEDMPLQAGGSLGRAPVPEPRELALRHQKLSAIARARGVRRVAIIACHLQVASKQPKDLPALGERRCPGLRSRWRLLHVVAHLDIACIGCRACAARRPRHPPGRTGTAPGARWVVCGSRPCHPGTPKLPSVAPGGASAPASATFCTAIIVLRVHSMAASCEVGRAGSIAIARAASRPPESSPALSLAKPPTQRSSPGSVPSLFCATRRPRSPVGDDDCFAHTPQTALDGLQHVSGGQREYQRRHWPPLVEATGRYKAVAFSCVVSPSERSSLSIACAQAGL